MALPHFDLTSKIIGAFYKVYNELGYGYSEKIYRRALAIVLREGGLEAVEEQELRVVFHGHVIGICFFDIVVNGVVLVEVKVSGERQVSDEAQTLNYLKCAGGGTALLVNFGRELKYKRLVKGDPEANLPNLQRSIHR